MKAIKIVSGRQTGADRAALTHGVECGGWCLKGRKAEDGLIDPRYPLKETPSAAYLQRTEWNVRDGDATVVFSIAATLTGGSLKTVEFARKHNRPRLHPCAGDNAAADKLKVLIGTNTHMISVSTYDSFQHISNAERIGDLAQSTFGVCPILHHRGPAKTFSLAIFARLFRISSCTPSAK